MHARKTAPGRALNAPSLGHTEALQLALELVEQVREDCNTSQHLCDSCKCNRQESPEEYTMAKLLDGARGRLVRILKMNRHNLVNMERRANGKA